MNKLTTFDLPFHRFSVGFDNIFEELSKTAVARTSNYPPYNIISTDVDGNQYVIELAVAGFKETELDISTEKNTLSVKGKKEDREDAPQYVYHGISSREFEQKFQLADYIVVTGASLQDGILSVSLERIIPDEAKPKKISISQQI